MILCKLLRGDRIRLSALTSSDIPTLACWYGDAGFMRLYDTTPAHPKSEAELAQWLQELHKDKNTFTRQHASPSLSPSMNSTCTASLRRSLPTTSIPSPSLRNWGFSARVHTGSSCSAMVSGTICCCMAC